VSTPALLTFLAHRLPLRAFEIQQTHCTPHVTHPVMMRDITLGL